MRKANLKKEFSRKIRAGGRAGKVRDALAELGLNTICQEGRCPNRHECYTSGTATFLIMGPGCTRNCTFCGVDGELRPPEPDEPERVARAAEKLGLKHVVITSTTRDDLADGGMSHFIKTVKAVKERLPAASVEVLTPDFGGVFDGLEQLLELVDVFNHNIETVPSLYPDVRPGACFDVSLELLHRAAAFKRENKPALKVKSGIMVGLGESTAGLKETFERLAEAGVDILTVGQYLPPGRTHMKPVKLYRLKEYDLLRELAETSGISTVLAGPYVRSSYHAREVALS